MMQKNVVLQDIFLNQVRKDAIGVTVHLMNGFQIKGFVRGFDSFILVMETEACQQMVLYKHAISTITPSKNVQISFPREEPEDIVQF